MRRAILLAVLWLAASLAARADATPSAVEALANAYGYLCVVADGSVEMVDVAVPRDEADGRARFFVNRKHRDVLGEDYPLDECRILYPNANGTLIAYEIADEAPDDTDSAFFIVETRENVDNLHTYETGRLSEAADGTTLYLPCLKSREDDPGQLYNGCAQGTLDLLDEADVVGVSGDFYTVTGNEALSRSAPVLDESGALLGIVYEQTDDGWAVADIGSLTEAVVGAAAQTSEAVGEEQAAFPWTIVLAGLAALALGLTVVLLCGARRRGGDVWILAGSRSTLQGKRFPITKRMVLGRDMLHCEIVFPENTPGVSKMHCMLYLAQDGGLMLMDMNSRYGTFVGGRKLSARQPYALRKGDAVWIGVKENKFVVRRGR